MSVHEYLKNKVLEYGVKSNVSVPMWEAWRSKTLEIRVTGNVRSEITEYEKWSIEYGMHRTRDMRYVMQQTDYLGNINYAEWVIVENMESGICNVGNDLENMRYGM